MEAESGQDCTLHDKFGVNDAHASHGGCAEGESTIAQKRHWGQQEER